MTTTGRLDFKRKHKLHSKVKTITKCGPKKLPSNYRASEQDTGRVCLSCSKTFPSPSAREKKLESWGGRGQGKVPSSRPSFACLSLIKGQCMRLVVMTHCKWACTLWGSTSLSSPKSLSSLGGLSGKTSTLLPHPQLRSSGRCYDKLGLMNM